MKRILLVLIAALLALGLFCGCRKKAADPFADMSTEQILEKLYENVDVELPNLAGPPITADNAAYYLGTDGIDFTEGTASEPLINAIAYSVCVLRLKNAADSTAAQQKIRDNVNPNKWICVGVDEQNVIVDGAGDVVILIMAEQAQALHAAFQTIAGK